LTDYNLINMTQIAQKSRLSTLKEILKDPERKSISKMIFELLYLTFTYRELPVHYFSRYLFKKNIVNIRDYVPNKMASGIAPFFNDGRVKEVIDNKLYFDLFYRHFGISLPEILMYNHKHKFVTGDTLHDVNDLEAFRALLEKLYDQNISTGSLFIKKTYSSASGRNTYKLTWDQFNKDSEMIKEIYDVVKGSEYLFQKTVIQHPELDKLNPACLNTIRIDSFMNSDGAIDIISAFIKLSIGSHVDNTVFGGCGVGIDLQTGKMKKYGWSKLRVAGVKVLEEHPVTKIRFENLEIPFFREVKELVIKTAGLMPGLRLIGWDVGIGESGPVLIEGNSDYGINSNDMMYGGYMANPVFRKILSEMN